MKIIREEYKSTTGMMSIPLTMLLACAMIFALVSCADSTSGSSGTDKQPVYKASAQSLYEGSLHYARAGCVACHGAKWDGSGSEAAALQKRSGLVATNFNAMSDPDKTPLSYFEVITRGSKALKKAGVKHSLQEYTDRGRWAMANFLYSMAPKLSGMNYSKRAAALTESRNKTRAAYERAAKNGMRRWEIGYKPARQRDPAPTLKDLMK